VRGVQGQALQPRDARSEVQGQIDCRCPGYERGGSSRPLHKHPLDPEQARNALPGRPRVREARPERNNALGRGSAADQAHKRARKAGHGKDPLPARRAYHRAPLRRCKEAHQGARRSRGEGQHGRGDRAQPGRDQVRGLPHRYRARRRGRRRGDRGNRDTGAGGEGEGELYRAVFEGDAGEEVGRFTVI